MRIINSLTSKIKYEVHITRDSQKKFDSDFSYFGYKTFVNKRLSTFCKYATVSKRVYKTSINELMTSR